MTITALAAGGLHHLFGYRVINLTVVPMFLTIDPASYPGRTDPSRVLIIEAGRDTCVPENCRDDLWEALGRPEKITLDYGHKKAFLSFTPLGNNWMRRQIWDFFEAKLLR